VDQPYSASPIPSESWSRARHRCPLDRRVRELGRSPALIGASELVHITSRFGRGPGPARQVNPVRSAPTPQRELALLSSHPDHGGLHINQLRSPGLVLARQRRSPGISSRRPRPPRGWRRTETDRRSGPRPAGAEPGEPDGAVVGGATSLGSTGTFAGASLRTRRGGGACKAWRDIRNASRRSTSITPATTSTQLLLLHV
jgi:hypothetical protein